MALALRPSFAVDVPAPSRQVIHQLAAQLALGPMVVRRTRPPGGGHDAKQLDHDHLVLTVPVAQQRIWSPWLAIEVSPKQAGTHVFARFSPHPSVWTGFAFGYITFGALLMFSLVFAGAQAMTGGQPWGLWGSVGAALALGGMWWASQIGQRLAHTQMDTLHAELERAIEASKPPAV